MGMGWVGKHGLAMDGMGMGGWDGGGWEWGWDRWMGWGLVGTGMGRMGGWGSGSGFHRERVRHHGPFPTPSFSETQRFSLKAA